MTSGLVRLYALVVAVLVFFVTWAIVAAHPWQTRRATPDPRLATLDARRRALRAESVRVRRVLTHRWQLYRVALRRRERAIAAARRARLAVTPIAAPAPAPAPVAPRVVYVQAPVATTRTS